MNLIHCAQRINPLLNGGPPVRDVCVCVYVFSLSEMRSIVCAFVMR